ncbi:MAG TPA: hypothetical protein VK324_15995, partial [Tepidisphaeraceae bacterium]|nr:hypothetical protein [Tepidisphaeraceae bacterium]
RRLGRRATLDELRALDLLASTPAEFGPPPMKVKDLLAAVDKRLADAKADFAVENRAGPDVAGRAVDYPRNATLMDALEAVVAQTEATWYPWGKSLVALPKDDQVRNQLAKTVNKRYNGVNVAQVLLELSQEAGVEFTIEPGAIQRLPPEARNVRMLLDNASVQQALEYIAGFTGLAYQVNDRGVAVWNPNTLPGTGGSARDPVVAILPLDGGGELLIQASQLPPDVRDYLRARVGRQVDRLREQMRVEGFKPSTANTQPATTPATQATP